MQLGIIHLHGQAEDAGFNAQIWGSVSSLAFGTPLGLAAHAFLHRTHGGLHP